MTSQIKELAVDPSDPNVVDAGNQSWLKAGVYKTDDGGVTWVHQNYGLSHRGVHCLNISRHDASVLYLGTGGNGAFIGKESTP